MCAGFWSCSIALDGVWLRTMGRQMIMDLDSWEAGYADGQLDRSFECRGGLDALSYAAGYRAASAYVAAKSRRLRYARSPTSAVARHLPHPVGLLSAWSDLKRTLSRPFPKAMIHLLSSFSHPPSAPSHRSSSHEKARLRPLLAKARVDRRIA
jgi:hypothetical protein